MNSYIQWSLTLKISHLCQTLAAMYTKYFNTLPQIQSHSHIHVNHIHMWWRRIKEVLKNFVNIYAHELCDTATDFFLYVPLLFFPFHLPLLLTITNSIRFTITLAIFFCPALFLLETICLKNKNNLIYQYLNFTIASSSNTQLN